MKAIDIFKTVYALVKAQGWPIGERPADSVLTFDDRVYIIKSPVKKPQITLESAIDQSFQRLKVRSNIKLVDKTK